MSGGISSDGIVSAYSKNPITYFYYELALKPKVDGSGHIIVSEVGAVTRLCSQEANALLTAYKGNGSSDKYCVRLGEKQPYNP